jgi:hypothetical protein
MALIISSSSQAFDRSKLLRIATSSGVRPEVLPEPIVRASPENGISPDASINNPTKIPIIALLVLFSPSTRPGDRLSLGYREMD